MQAKLDQEISLNLIEDRFNEYLLKHTLTKNNDVKTSDYHHFVYSYNEEEEMHLKARSGELKKYHLNLTANKYK